MSMATKSSLIILDLGGVVFNVNEKQFRNNLCSVAKAEVATAVVEDIRSSSAHDLFEEGKISDREFFRAIRHMLPQGFSFSDFADCWVNIYHGLVDGAVDALRILSSRTRVVALTNSNSLHETVWRDIYKDVLPLFRRIYSSHLIGHRKPSAESFQHVLDSESSLAENTIFVDDLLHNIIAARSLGMTGFHCHKRVSLATVAQNF